MFLNNSIPNQTSTICHPWAISSLSSSFIGPRKLSISTTAVLSPCVGSFCHSASLGILGSFLIPNRINQRAQRGEFLTLVTCQSAPRCPVGTGTRRARKQSRCQAQHTSYTHKHGHLQLKLTAEKSKWEMHRFLKPNHYTCQQIISTEQKSRMCSGTAHGIHGVDFSLEHTFTLPSGYPSGKGSLLLPAIVFCSTDYFCSHSFH